MAKSTFHHVRVAGITAVVPENAIDIDDELEFFRNDAALLARNKKILGLGTRHVADDRTTNADLCEAAANDLFAQMGVPRESVDALIAVSCSHDYKYPASACILHGRLGLAEECSCFDVSGLACSAYVHGLWLAHSLVSGGAAKRCLVLAGEVTSKHSDRRNRNSNMLFGDAGTATLVEWTDEERPAWFLTGTRGTGWDKLMAPAGGWALPVEKDIVDLEITDATGNVWHLWDEIMKGMDIFKFATDVGPKGVRDILEFSGKSLDDIDYVAFHQANKQIVRTIAGYIGVPKDKYSTEAFTRYGNCGTAAVTMDLVRRLGEGPLGATCLATFGVGLSWGFAVLDMAGVHCGGVRAYSTPADKPSRAEQIAHWIRHFKGESDAQG